MVDYTMELKRMLNYSEIEAKNLNDKYIDSHHYILSLLKHDKNINNVFKKYNITYNSFLCEVKKSKIEKGFINIYSLNLKKIIDCACYYNKNEKKIRVDNYNCILSLLKNDESQTINILNKMNVNVSLLYKEFKKQNNNKTNLYIKEIGVDLNLKAKLNEFDKTIGRKKEIQRLIEILARKNKNNPILIGEAGVGKTAIVEELAKKIVSNNVPNFLKNTTIISVNISSLVSGTKYRGDFEEKLNKIIKELEDNKKIIMFIDEIHTLVGAGGAEGAIDASNILKPALSRGNIKCIGATTINEYKKYIEKDKALDRRFQKIYIEEPNNKETLTILKRIKKDYEKYHNVKVNDNVLEKIVYLSKKYINDRKEPDRSIDILDEICAKAEVKNKNDILCKQKKELEKIITKKHNAIKTKDYKTASIIRQEEKRLEKTINTITNKPKIKEVTINDLKNVLEYKSNSLVKELNKNINYDLIKEKIKENIIGQDNIIDNIINIINTNDDDKKPLSFLFNGKSGVGKTLLAKRISQELKYNFIKLNMSEYSSDMSINKIIGSSQGYVGYEDVNTVFEKMKDKPNSLILLDEIDKANEKVVDLFLNILDEGYLTNSKGENLYFNNSIFILTTNKIKNKTNCGYIKDNYQTNYDSFDKEYINRIDYLFTFNSLNKDNIEKIIMLYSKKYNKKIDSNAINNIINNCKYNKYGARKIKNLFFKEINKKNVYI